MKYLINSALQTQCPYKGKANYYSIKIGDASFENYALCYPSPIYESVKIKGFLCFYNEKVDIYDNDELMNPSITPFS